MLSDTQKKFLQKRTALQKLWSWCGGIALFAWGAFWVYCFYKVPLLANPFHVLEKLEANEINESTLLLHSGILPVLFNALGFVVLFLIIFWIDRMLTEKKFLEIVQLLKKAKE